MSQGGHPHPPRIKVCKSLSSLELRGSRIIPHPRKTSRTITDALHSARGREGAREVTVAIGPESGWSDDEVDLFEGRGFEVVTLGNEILTCAEAATVAVGVVRDVMGSSFVK